MIKRLLAPVLVCTSLISFSQSRLSEQIGSIKKTTAITGGYEFELTNAFARVTAYNATTIRIRISKQKFTDDQSYAVDDLTPKGKMINPNKLSNLVVVKTV